MKKSTLRLPKLKTRDELLRTAPELGRYLASADGDGPGAALPGRATSPLTKPRSPAGKPRPTSARRLGRLLTEDETTEEERVRADLERVKAERAALLESLAKLQNDAGKSGGELQQEDIRLLQRELEAKKEKLNELRRATLGLSDAMEQLETTSRDCEQLMPTGEESLQARVAQLAGELAGVEQDILEAEAKHELYKLLEIRTRRDHAASEQRMRDARALTEGASDDFTTLTKQMHEMRAAKEDAERELGGVVAMYDQVKGDWQRKLKDRRKEVRELERRKAEDERRKAQQAAITAEKTRIEQEKTARSKSERDAANARLSAVVPELESLEAAWARLHGICGANTAEDLIAYWQELKAKEASMRELVRLAEVREARAKEEMAALLAERAEVFDTETARGARRQALEQELASAQETAAGEQASGQQEQQQEQQEGDETPAQEEGTAAPRPEGGEAEAEAAAGQGSDAGAEGSAATSDSASPRAELASGEASAEGAPAAAAAAASAVPAASPEAAIEQVLREKQLAITEARRRKAAAKEKFSKLSQVCAAADQGLHLLALRLKASMNADEAARRRTTLAGGAGGNGGGMASRRVTSTHRRTTGQHQAVRRISASKLVEHRCSTTFLHAPPEATPRAPAGTSIHDKEFFPELPTVLSDVNGQLGRLMALVDQLEVASAAAAASQAAGAALERAQLAAGDSTEGSSASSSFIGATEASELGMASARAAAPAPTSGKRLQWADGQEGQAGGEGQPTPRVQSMGQGGEQAEEVEEAAAAAAEGEKSLRKGFRRRTWAGPAWLDAVRAGKPLTASLMRKAGGSGGPAPGSPSKAAAAAALQRIVGYVEEPGSSGDEGPGGRKAGANPFDLEESEDELGEDGGVVVDRQYIKHRAHKLTNPKQARGKQDAAGAGSPAVSVDAR